MLVKRDRALEVKIDHTDPTLLHDQVSGAIRRAIAEGEAKSGDRLPPARDLAAVLGVNSNTVLRALRDYATRASWSSGVGEA
jgi:GntR family transcriptional regulator